MGPSVQIAGMTEQAMQHGQTEIPSKSQDAQQEWKTKQGRKNKNKPKDKDKSKFDKPDAGNKFTISYVRPEIEETQTPESSSVDPVSGSDQALKQIASEEPRTKVQQVQVQVQEDIPVVQVQVTIHLRT